MNQQAPFQQKTENSNNADNQNYSKDQWQYLTFFFPFSTFSKLKLPFICKHDYVFFSEEKK